MAGGRGDEGAMKETFDRIRDRHDCVRTVVDSVRTDMRGEPHAEIAAELARRLAAAGLPDLPENVDQKAALIGDLPNALISLGAALVRVVAGRSGPAGLRRESRYLDGATWTPIGVTVDPLAQRTLRIFDTMRPGDAREMYIGRLVAVPSDEVAVFLGSTFIGMLPTDATRAVRPIAEQTDAADQKLLVKGKITSSRQDLLAVVRDSREALTTCRQPNRVRRARSRVRHREFGTGESIRVSLVRPAPISTCPRSINRRRHRPANQAPRTAEMMAQQFQLPVRREPGRRPLRAGPARRGRVG
jgi:hypothetical protein